jgi:S-DNA-T family DNA segregation ATPase FtsK/SpoIIIE
MSRRSSRARRRADRAARRERAESTALALYQPRDAELATAHASGEVPEDVTGAEAGGLVPVDLAEDETPAGLRAVLAAKAAERRPVVPGWVRDRDELRYAVRWLAGHVWHTLAYHLMRAPVYVGRIAARAPVGAWRLLGDVSRWAGDAEGVPLRVGAVHTNDPEMYMKLSRQRLERMRWRTILIAAAVLAVALGTTVGLALAPAWARPLTVLAIVAGLVWRGSSGDRPLLDRAVVPHKVAKLTSEHIIRALGSLGLAEINKALGKGGVGITFPAPITKDGPGWRADVDLPHGVTAVDIMERRERLASGLRRPLGCVWPEPAHDAHAGRLVLWVGYEDMNKTRQAPWPLAKSGTADVFRAIPFGTDQRGRIVYLVLIFESVLIGAMPRQGKTAAMRVILLALALDTNVQLRVFELKGTGDLSALEKVAHEYGTGQHDDTIAAAVASLRQLLHEELPRRTRTIANLPRDLAPENKVTPDLATKKSLGLFPIVLAVDECQELFMHPLYGSEAAELCLRLIKLGPAVGIILILATQRPDKDSLPTGISANVGVRFCLRVMDQIANDMILGTSRYKTGVRATTFTTRDKGIGYLVGATDDPQITRSFYLDGPAADKIGDRARALRLAKDGLTGYAAGQPTGREPGPGYSLLDDLDAALGTDQQAWSVTILDRLADLRPDVYAGWTAQQLASALKPHGVPTKQVWQQLDGGRGSNRRGITRADLHKALGQAKRRELTSTPPPDTTGRGRLDRPPPPDDVLPGDLPGIEGGDRSA